MRILKTAFVAVVTLNLVFAPSNISALSSEDEDSQTARGKNPTQGSGSSAFLAAMMAASAGDVASTELGLARGMSEANPLASHRGVRVAAHAASTALAWYGTEKLRKAGHPRIALVARIGFIAAYGYATAHNLRTTYSAR